MLGRGIVRFPPEASGRVARVWRIQSLKHLTTPSYTPQASWKRSSGTVSRHRYRDFCPVTLAVRGVVQCRQSLSEYRARAEGNRTRFRTAARQLACGTNKGTWSGCRAAVLLFAIRVVGFGGRNGTRRVSMSENRGIAMQDTPILSADELAHFEQKGYVHLRAAFARSDAQAMQDFMWEKLEALHGIEKTDRTTWSRAQLWTQGLAPQGLNRSGEHPIYQPIGTSRLCGAIAQLLGAGTWDIPQSWGGFFFTFPQGRPDAWELPSEGWHWDGNPSDQLDALNGLFLFLLFGDLEPHGGGTLFVAGSRRLVDTFFRGLPPEVWHGRQKPLKRRFVLSHPWLTELTHGKRSEDGEADRIHRWMSQATDVAGISAQVVEVTGAPGDVYLCHPSIFHAPSPNHAAEPRIMRIKSIARRAGALGLFSPPDPPRSHDHPHE